MDIDRETDGRWLGEIPELPGVLAYGSSRDEAVTRTKALAFRVLAAGSNTERTSRRFTGSSPSKDELVGSKGESSSGRLGSNRLDREEKEWLSSGASA